MSYAVVWSENDGPVCAGSLELAAEAVRLSGSAAGKKHVSRTVRYPDLADVHLERSTSGHRAWSPALVLVDSAGDSVAIGSLQGLGALHELADDLIVAAIESTS